MISHTEYMTSAANMKGFGCATVLALVLCLQVSTGQQVVIQGTRLVGGPNQRSGRVEVQIGGEWGTVCDDQWDDLDARVVCRSLGHSGGTAYGLARFGPGSGPIHMDNVFCQGNERSLGECGFVTGAEVNCQHAEDASVECDPGLPAGQSTLSPTTTTPRQGGTLPDNCNQGTNQNAQVRLFGTQAGIGYVQARHPNGTFGFVCDDGWDVNAAKIVCRELCYTNMSVVTSSMKSEFEVAVPNPLIALDDIRCVGNEASLVNCNHSTWFVHNCADTELAKVTCTTVTYETPPPPQPELQCREGDLIVMFNTSRDPNLEPKHLTIANYPANDPNCNFNPAFTADGNFIQAKISFEQCGTRVRQNATHIIYTNAIHVESTSRQGDISRVNQYRVELTCEMPRNDVVTNVIQPLTETVTQKTEGQFVIQLKIYEDQAFTQVVNSTPFQLPLGDWLNAAVDLESVDSRLKLVVSDCNAKADNTPNAPVVPLFQNKCVTERTLEVHPINAVKFGLRFQPFIFVGYNDVILECAALVCLQSEVTEECDRSCNNAKPPPATGTTAAPAGRRRRSVGEKHVYLVRSQPVQIVIQQRTTPAVYPGTRSPTTLKSPSATSTTTTTSTLRPATMTSTVGRIVNTTKTILISSTLLPSTHRPSTTPRPTTPSQHVPTTLKQEEQLGAGSLGSQGQTRERSEEEVIFVRSTASSQCPSLLVLVLTVMANLGMRRILPLVF